jgi:hypothetical protein
MSLFYKSNESKERKYVKENKIRELNEEAQQQIVDDAIDTELGLDRKATNIGLLSKRVAEKLISSKPEIQNGELILLSSINNGKLSELFNKIQLLPDSDLTKNQQYIRDNLKNKQNKDIINGLIEQALPDGVEAIKSVILEALGGENNKSSLLDLINKANKLNIKDYANTVQPSSKKSKNKENELMAKEDINYAVKPIASKPATPAQIEAQNKAQADLDLISLFQQDVKEARKKQALKDLDQLSADEDLRLRKNFKSALEDMMDEVNNRSATAKARKQYKEDKMILDKMMQLIENQRMHDSFIEFSKAGINEALKEKLYKNLRSLVNERRANKAITSNRIKRTEISELNDMGQAHNEKKTNNLIKSDLKREYLNMYNTAKAQEAIVNRKVNKIKLYKPIESKTKSRSLSDTTTEQGTLAGEKIDLRNLNKGAPKNNTNEELNKFTDLLVKFHNSKGRERSEYNQVLNNIMSRQQNLAIVKRMKDMKSSLHRR